MFEEFTPLFGKWYSGGEPCACFIGIRTQESLNRYRTVAREKPMFKNKAWTTNVIDDVWNIYPIYDWTDNDVWDFIKEKNIKLAPVYANGFNRLGCVGCPLVSRKGVREKEFAAYPKFYEQIKKSIILKNNPTL